METCTSLPAFEASESTQQFLADKLVDQTLPISERFRALFSLRNLTGSIPREALISATNDPSNLLAHEAAFALGQMQDAEAVPALQAILLDYSRHPIVRHEKFHNWSQKFPVDARWGSNSVPIRYPLAYRDLPMTRKLEGKAAEALGAIGLDDNIPLLKNCLKKDPAKEVRETCELALRRLEEKKHRSADKESSTSERSPFFSVDPAAPASAESRVEELRKVLLDEEKGMYERYAALFALRNRGGAEAVDAVVAALQAQSALLRHEVAYVLGQLQDKVSSVALSETLRDANEHPMVRHEAAEALGSIADSESITLLKQYEKDTEPIVSQSCEVALSMLEFEQSGKSFEYLLFQSPEVH